MFALPCLLLGMLHFAVGESDDGASDSRPLIVVRGAVCDRETRQGVADVEIVLTNGRVETTVRSDSEGRFEARVPSGMITGEVKHVPARYARPSRAFRAPVVIPPHAAEQTLPEIELPLGRSVRGQVVDEAGRGVPGAEVQACWVAVEPWMGNFVLVPRQRWAIADDRGEFNLTGLAPLDRVRLGARGTRIFAHARQAATSALQELGQNLDQPITLRVDGGQSTSLEGRVIDADGRPVVGARVEIHTQWQSDNGFQIGYSPIAFSGQTELRTDAEGRYRTAQRVGRNGEYAAIAHAPGYLHGRTGWLRGGEKETTAFADLQLLRLRTVSGRVFDRQGKPLASVRVFQAGDGVERTETTSDPAGCYELPGVSEGTAFLFAQGASYRFHGQAIAPGAEGADITLTRVNEPAEAVPPQPPVLMPRDEELALVRAAYRPYFERAMASSGPDEQWDALFGWIRLNPADAIAYIGDDALPGRSAEDYEFLRSKAASILFREAPDDALALVESLQSADSRLRAYFEIAGVVSPSEQGLKRRLLEEALLNSQAVAEPPVRAVLLQGVADAFLDLGDADRARTIMEQAQAFAAAAPKAGSGGSARSYFAETLARIDLPAAIELMQEIGEDRTRHRTFGRMAFRIAASQPADAERLLERIADPYDRAEWLVRVCHRTTPADPQRARRLADAIENPYLKAHALGLMARAWAATDKVLALRWVDEAFDILARMIAAGEERLSGWHNAAMVAGALVPAVEQIDPQLVPEYFWRAVSCRRDYSITGENEVQTGTAMLALLLAQYDRRIARTLVEPIVAARLSGAHSLPGALAFDAACIIDPRWAIELVQRLPDDRAQSRRHSFFALAWMFSIRPEIRVAESVRNYNLLWLPGEPDNAFQAEF